METLPGDLSPLVNRPQCACRACHSPGQVQSQWSAGIAGTSSVAALEELQCARGTMCWAVGKDRCTGVALLSPSHAGVSGGVPGHMQAPSLPGRGHRTGLAGHAPGPRDSVDGPRVVLVIESARARDAEAAWLQTVAAVRALGAPDCVALAVIVDRSSTFVFWARIR